MSIRRSSSPISTLDVVASSGATITCANDVCRRCAWSNGDRRTSRCTPRSAFRMPYAFSPRTVKVADLSPYSSPGLASISSRLESAALGPAQVHAQQHLGPVLRVGAALARVDRDDGVARVVLAVEERVLLQPLELVAERHDRPSRSRRRCRRPSRAAPWRPRSRAGAARSARAACQARVLGRDRRRALLVVPESRCAELGLELGEPLPQALGVKGNHGPSRAGPRSPRAAGPAGWSPSAMAAILAVARAPLAEAEARATRGRPGAGGAAPTRAARA